MKQCYLYKNEKSDKFWWIDYSDTSLAINYGKTGTIGKYQVKEFDNPLDCQKSAQKIIAEKIKKGYVATDNYDFINHFYFDDDEIGLHEKTSHPHFRHHFTDQIYTNCWDEESPFGSDEGADTLNELTEALRKKPDLDCATFPRTLIEKIWQMKYITVTSLCEEDVRTQLLANELCTIQSDMITYSTAFGQIKIQGKIDPELKKMALDAMARYQLTAKILQWGNGEPSPIMQKMIDDLSTFSSSE